MGCFNEMGFHTHLPIVYGDDIVLFLGVNPQYKRRCLPDYVEFAPGCSFTPIALPIFGKYNDYGNIEDIVRDENVEAIERFFNLDIYQVLRIIDDNMIGRGLDGDKKELYGMWCDRIHDMQTDFTIKSEFCCKYDIVYTMDHRFMYDTIRQLMPPSYDFNLSIKYTNNLDPDDMMPERRFQEYNKDKYYWNNDRIICVEPGFKYYRTYWHGIDGFDESSALAVYNSDVEKKVLYNKLTKEYVDFLTFINIFIKHQWCFRFHVYGTQETHGTTALPYYEMMVKKCKEIAQREIEDVEDIEEE